MAVARFADHLPLLLALQRRLDLADPVDTALGVGEGAVLFEEGRAGQEDMGEGGGLVQEQILHDDAVHGAQRLVHMLGVGIRLGDVLTLHEQALESAFHRLVEHVGDTEARLIVELRLPHRLEDAAHDIVVHVAVARELMRERTHVAGALHIILSTERIDAHPVAPDIAGEHGEVGHADHHG